MQFANNSFFFAYPIAGTLPASSRNVRNLPGVPTRAIVAELEYEWRPMVSDRLEKLIRLEHGWDGYRAEPVSFDNASFALRMLEKICPSDSPTPQIVPGRNGDLQIEWHTETGDIELHVRGPNDVHAWRCIQGDDEDGFEMNLTNDFIEVSRWITNLMTTGEEIAANAAAA